MSDKIPALSIRQPWAWAIIFAGKNIENRDWSTNFRGEFYVHAAKGMTHTEYQYFEEIYNVLRRNDRKLRLPELPAPALLLKGGIVGKATLVDCVQQHPSPWFFGKYGFVLKDAQYLDFIRLRGQLGFFNVDLNDKDERLV